MKTSQPTLSTRPPRNPIDADEALRRLESVKDWTEQPSRDAAAALSPQGAEATPRTDASAEVKQDAPVRTKMPWEEEGLDNGVQSFNIRLPARLAAKVRFLGGSTYGHSINSIVNMAVATQVGAMLKERGLE
jgi:hypothetical protein